MFGTVLVTVSLSRWPWRIKVAPGPAGEPVSLRRPPVSWESLAGLGPAGRSLAV